MKSMLIIMGLIVLQGCTHTLYQSDIVSKNNLDEDQSYRLWWIKTSILSNDKGSGSMTLDMGCDSKTLTDSADGIVMELPADRYTSVTGQQAAEITCAKVTNLKTIKRFKQGDIVMKSFCEPKPDDFSISKTTFLNVQTAHVFPITKSAIKDTGYAPSRLPCR